MSYVLGDGSLSSGRGLTGRILEEVTASDGPCTLTQVHKAVMDLDASPLDVEERVKILADEGKVIFDEEKSEVSAPHAGLNG